MHDKPVSIILRANSGMIRDAFVVEDKSPESAGKVLVIRQTKFDEQGALGANESKVIRLPELEANMLIQFWQTERKN